MKRFIGFSLLLMGASSFAFAGMAPSPEIDPSAAAGAVALLLGGVAVLRARRRKQ
ncbi:MAG: hypothetical protein ACRD30_00615 [Bryobacteraceae bacterium]